MEPLGQEANITAEGVNIYNIDSLWLWTSSRSTRVCLSNWTWLNGIMVRLERESSCCFAWRCRVDNTWLMMMIMNGVTISSDVLTISRWTIIWDVILFEILMLNFCAGGVVNELWKWRGRVKSGAIQGREWHGNYSLEKYRVIIKSLNYLKRLRIFYCLDFILIYYPPQLRCRTELIPSTYLLKLARLKGRWHAFEKRMCAGLSYHWLRTRLVFNFNT